MSHPSQSRIALVTSISLFAVLGSATPAFAQAEPGVSAAESEAADAPVDIIVTGSRIARPEIDAANPITSVTAETIEQSGRTNITDFLIQLPALGGSLTSADNSGSGSGFGTTGLNQLNLRNLGTNRTLVLVDGRRHVSALPGSASVDVNTIPTDLIERVDVLTGGASAIYGADGVSGVVNFVLKRDFDGIAARAQTGISQRGDAGNRFGSITAGKNFADGRGNIALAYEFNDDDRVNSFERSRTGDPLRTFGLVRNPDDFPDSPSVFDRVLTNDLRYADSSRDGAVDIDFDGLSDFTGSGGLYDRGRLLRQSGGLTQGGSSTPLAGYQGDLQPKNRRHVVNLLTSYEFSDAFRVFAQGKYVDTHAFSVAQPTFDFFSFISPDNPYIPANIAAVAPDGVLLSRDNFDLGIRGETVDRETLRGVIGADGAISEHARYEVSYVYGQTKTRNQSDNNRLGDRYFAALDALRDPRTGQIVCRSTLFPGDNIDPNNFDQPATTFTPGAAGGCAPLNLFGENVASQAALDFVTVDNVSFSKIDQHVVSGSVSGDFGAFFELPGGPVRFAIGAEYRRESSQSNPDQLYIDGAVLDSAQILPEGGNFNVKEVFAELEVPLLKNVPFAETLTAGAAIRLSDYSTVGKTTTWQFTGVYAPVEDIRFRGTYSQAVRAPNIGELFGASSGTFQFIDDPCDPVNIPEGTQFRQANCTTVLTGLGINPATFSPTSDPEATVSLPGISGGNPNLREETAKTWTAGVVLAPSFIRGLNISLDWYNIRLRNAVNTATAQEIVDLCVDQPDLDNQFCDSITRDPATGFVNNYVVGPQNVAAFRTSGAEVKVNYTLETARVGTFGLRVVGGYLDTLSFTPTIGADIDNDRREQFAPRFQATADVTWSKGPLTLNYGVNWFDKTRRYTTEQITANPDLADPRYIFFKQKWEHDIFASVDVDERFTFYGGVNNLTDEKPSVASSTYPVSFVGRYFFVGAKLKLADLF